jgi:uncharacterized protein YceK
MRMRNILSVILLASTVGCASITTVFTPESRLACGKSASLNRIYSGTAMDISYVSHFGEDAGIAILDLPFSVVADSVLLLYTVPMQVVSGSRSCRNASIENR